MSFKPTCPKCGDKNAASATRCDGCGAPLYDPPTTRTKGARGEHGRFVPKGTPGAVADPPRLPPRQREKKGERYYGCVVAFENDEGQTLVLHRGTKGRALKGLEEACETALALDPTFRVVAYSTPQTILADLHGRADRYSGHERPSNRHSPESIALGQCGRPELLHPRLR